MMFFPGTGSRRLRRRGAGRSRVLGLVLAAAVSCAPTLAIAAELESELAKLLVEHPSIQAAEKRYISATYGIDVAEAGFLPQVNLSTSGGPQKISTPTTRTTDGDDQFNRTGNVATLFVTHNLFDGDFTESSAQTARLTAEQAAVTLAQTRQATLFEGIRVYIDVVRQKRLVDLGRENVDNIQQQLNLEDERVQRGSGIAVDVLEAKSRLQIAKERLVGFEGSLRNAAATYKQVFGRAPDIENMTDPWPPVELVPVSLDEAVETAMLNNPAMLNSAASVEIARERKEGATADYLPSLDLEGTMNYERNNEGTTGIRRDYSVVLRASWDIFTGFATPALVNQAAYEYRASRDTHDLTRRRTTEQVRVAWESLITTRDRSRLLENAVNIAAEVYASRLKLRAAGQDNVINVLDAENQVTTAQINFTSTAYDVRLASYQLLLTMGLLTAENLNLPTA
ncbi:MAG: TolC family outer membrane protein [Rhodospirillales bacterium]